MLLGLKLPLIQQQSEVKQPKAEVDENPVVMVVQEVIKKEPVRLKDLFADTHDDHQTSLRNKFQPKRQRQSDEKQPPLLPAAEPDAP